MREIVFIADRKEGLEPAFSEGPVRTLSRWLSFIHGTVQMHRGHNPPARKSYSITSLPSCSTYKQESLQRPLQAVTFVLDHLLETQDHNLNLATSLLVSCGTRQNSRSQTLGKWHQETEEGEGPRGQAQNTPSLQSWSLRNPQPRLTPFTAGVLRTQAGRSRSSTAHKRWTKQSVLLLSHSCWDIRFKNSSIASCDSETSGCWPQHGEFPIFSPSLMMTIVAGWLMVSSQSTAREF